MYEYYPRSRRTALLDLPDFRNSDSPHVLHFSVLLCTSLHFSSQRSQHYLPMQNRLNTTSNTSSTPTCPPIFPISPAAYRSSSAAMTTSLRSIPGPHRVSTNTLLSGSYQPVCGDVPVSKNSSRCMAAVSMCPRWRACVIRISLDEASNLSVARTRY